MRTDVDEGDGGRVRAQSRLQELHLQQGGLSAFRQCRRAMHTALHMQRATTGSHALCNPKPCALCAVQLAGKLVQAGSLVARWRLIADIDGGDARDLIRCLLGQQRASVTWERRSAADSSNRALTCNLLCQCLQRHSKVSCHAAHKTSSCQGTLLQTACLLTCWHRFDT